MIIGSLGDILFEVSEETMALINGMTWSGEANIATHQRAGGANLIEFTGTAAQSFSFELTLSGYLMQDPGAMRDQLIAYWSSGTPVTLVFGSKRFGRYKWLVTGWSDSDIKTLKNGDILSEKLSVNLTEFLTI